MKKKFILIMILLLLLPLILSSVNIQEVLDTLERVDIKLLIPLLLFQLVTLSLIAYQWYYLLNKDSYRISFLQVLKVNFAASFIESITPSSKFGGEAAKIFLLRKEIKEDYTKLTITLIVYKYISLLPFFTIVSSALLISFFKYNIPLYIYIVFVSSILSIVLAWKLSFYYLARSNQAKFYRKSSKRDIISLLLYKLDKIKEFISTSLGETRGYLNKKDRIKLMAISFFIWFSYPLKIYLVAKILNINLDMILCYIATFVSYVVSILPLSPGGMGTFEGSMAFVFNINAMNFSEGMAIALVTRLIVFWFPLLISFLVSIYITFFERGKKDREIFEIQN